MVMQAIKQDLLTHQRPQTSHFKVHDMVSMSIQLKQVLLIGHGRNITKRLFHENLKQ